jgi:hypothetical protein
MSQIKEYLEKLKIKLLNNLIPKLSSKEKINLLEQLSNLLQS